MSGIFNTLNIANKGLMSQQIALHTTGHNIANANTEGFSRQRVELKADLPYNYVGVGQLGTGVKMESVVRIVNDYVGKQIREENGTLQEFTAKAEVMEQLEVIFNEPSDTSLNFNIGEMFDAWVELSKNPEMLTSKTIVVEKSKTLAATFNHMMDQIDNLEEETLGMIDKNITDFNSIVDQLDTLNKQIFNISVKGHLPNDLLDQRDLLLKDLSSIANFDADFSDKYGRVSIKIGNQSILETTGAKNRLELDGKTVKIQGGNDITDSIITGEIRGRLSGLEDLENSRKDLDIFGSTMSEAINTIHRAGVNSIDFFEYADGELKVNDALTEDSSLVNVGKDSESAEGDGSRALAISRLRNTKINFQNPVFELEDDGLTLKEQEGGNTIGGYYNDIVTSVGISKQHADNMVENQDILLGQLELRRESISGVSIDEEVSNLIKFQSAYAANARVISTLTEMLDTLINRMGV